MSKTEVVSTMKPKPPPVPLGTLIGRELRNEKVEKPTIKYGQAALAKKGEDYFLIKPDCRGFRAIRRHRFQFSRKLCMREDGKQQVCIVGLQQCKVSDVETIQELIEKGNATRSAGTTGANEESSRSHAILQLAIKRSADGSESKPPRVVGKLSFIDLAGSE